MSDPNIIASESVVDCVVCDKPNRTDIYDDKRSGDWAYVFQCTYCDHINDEHGTREDRGAAEVARLILLSFLILAFGCGLISLLGRWWPGVVGATWVVAVVIIVAVIHGAKQGEETHE